MHSVVFICIAFTFLIAPSHLEEIDNEDAYLTVPQLITKYGYPVEEHFVTTTDGYILALHRIPGNSVQTPRKTVFLQHGILGSSAAFIVTGTTHGLGYILADQGYDVWMGNARGNRYSRNHTTLNPDTDSEFWKFSWHEIGAIDLPTLIDYVLETTNQPNLYYVGHSQGTTTFYVMASMFPEYNDKIIKQFSMAPIGYMSHMTSPLLHILAFWSGPLELLTELIGLNEFKPSSNFTRLLGDTFCGDDDITQIICTNVQFAICGFSPNEMNTTLLPILMGHTPGGSSVMQMMHYAQEINSGAFRQYDFGSENLDKYGTTTPPDYDLSLITAPIYLFYSTNDWLSAVVDVEQLCEEIGDACAGKILVADGDFNHLDYTTGIRAPELIYSQIIDLMNDEN